MITIHRREGEIELVSVSYSKDKNAVSHPTRESTRVFCGIKSISQTVFYAAKQSGLKPAYVFVVKSFEYDGQEEVLFEGKSYRVIRAYEGSNYITKGTHQTDIDEIELTVEEAAGIGERR